MAEIPIVYLCIKFHRDQSNKMRIENMMNAITALNCNCHCMVLDETQTTEDGKWCSSLMKKALSLIDKSNLVLVETTEKGVGIGIEAGYALARNIPIITVAEQDADISATLRGISKFVGTYSDQESLEKLLRNAFAHVISSTIQ